MVKFYLLGKGFDKTGAVNVLTMSTLEKAGFVLNHEKSMLTGPTRHVKWLGFEIDLEKGCTFVPKKK